MEFKRVAQRSTSDALFIKENTLYKLNMKLIFLQFIIADLLQICTALFVMICIYWLNQFWVEHHLLYSETDIRSLRKRTVASVFFVRFKFVCNIRNRHLFYEYLLFFVFQKTKSLSRIYRVLHISRMLYCSNVHIFIM